MPSCDIWSVIITTSKDLLQENDINSAFNKVYKTLKDHNLSVTSLSIPVFEKVVIEHASQLGFSGKVVETTEGEFVAAVSQEVKVKLQSCIFTTFDLSDVCLVLDQPIAVGFVNANAASELSIPIINSFKITEDDWKTNNK